MSKLLNLIKNHLPIAKKKRALTWHDNQRLIILSILVLFTFVAAILFFIRFQKEKQQLSYESAPDSTIIPVSGNYAFINETNNFKTKFKKTPFSKKSVSFVNPKGSISFYTLKDQVFGSLQNTIPQYQANVLTYPDIFPGVSLRYTISPTRLLEEFIVQEASTAIKLTKIEQIANSYNNYRENDDGSVTFTKGKDEAFILPKPVIYELGNKENKSYGIKYEISRSLLGEITISKILTPEGISWLSEPSRNYPIAIDLVIDNADTAGNWISSDSTNTTVSQETTIKHGGTGSVKVQTTAGTFPGDVDLFEFNSDQAARASAITNTIAATGGTITNVGGYTIHTFTSSGTFTVTSGSGNVEVLTVAGGGGGGSDMGGGGGGGGVVYNSAYAVTPGAVTVTVGGGGAGAAAGIGSARGVSGQNSVFGSITAVGGGGGGSEYSTGTNPPANGGSGGGTAGGAANQVAGTGTVGQGYDGGRSLTSYYPGGGGGAGGPGRSNPGNGGPGLPFSINGTWLYYGGGGGGAGYSNIAGNGGIGGAGGGAPKVLVTGGGIGGGQALNTGADGTVGTLVSQTNVPGGSAGANTGGGGGGGAHYNSNNYGGNGGSGVVIVRYPTAGFTSSGYISNASGLNATGGIISYSGGYKIHTFLQSDSFNIISGSGNVETLVVAGGGGGGSDMGGGGGGGGVVYNSAYAVTPGKMAVTVGDGGAGAAAGIGSARGVSGQNSVFGSITAVGGGGGGSEYSTGTNPPANGGSGGGTAGGAANQVAGTGTVGQGYAGGRSLTSYYPGGGGGGGGVGGTNPGDGGIGVVNAINGTSLYWAGGGAGAGYSARAGNGGLGGGGGGGPRVSGGGLGGGSAFNPGLDSTVGTLVSQTNVPGGSAGANTGGGGGGGAHYNSNNYGGNGGSGIVIIRYQIPPLEVFSSDGFSASNGSVSNSGGNTIHTFTSSGTFSVNNGSEYAKVMVIGGGGGAGSDMGGGGGAGGYVYYPTYQLVEGNYLVNIGTGGNGAAAGISQLRGANGNDTVFNVLKAFGGGGGGSEYSTGSAPPGYGGSGGGTAGGADNQFGGGGFVGQGYAGGRSLASYYPGGGGGAGGSGGTNPGDGGIGVVNAINGTSLYWAGGGGGAGYSLRAGNGGLGGGGGGGPKVSGGGLGGGSALNTGADGTVGTLVSQTNVPGGSAGANTGGGGGGGAHYNSNNYGGNGGSGIVIISYPTPVATIKTEGSYALKAFALATVSVNKTLTRTIAAPLNLSTSESVTFDIRSSRTGSNIKVGLHDVGGTTTEITPNITVANTWQPVLINLTGVSAGNKDAIDQIIITVVDASADNTFYLDNMKNVIPSSYQDTVSITKSAIDLSNTAMLNFWVRSSVAGSFGQFQFGESNANEQTFNFTVSAPNNWEQKTWDISAITGTAKNAVTKLAFQFISNTSGATFYFDDLTVSPPNIPSLDLPTNAAINQSLFTVLKTTGVDDGGHYLRYKIQLCTDVGMTAGCQIFDQTSSQTGWSGQDAQTSTAYSSGVQATYTIQTTLLANNTYYWRSYAIDPGATNTWSSTQAAPYSFTTSANPSAPTNPYAEGTSNPSSILDLTPEFSAIHNDTNGDSAIYYQIEVNSAADFTGTAMWDSGQQSISPLANGARSTDVPYAGTALTLNGQTYYWRIRFWDSFNLISPWSSVQNFSMNKIPDIPTLDFPSNAATDQYLNTSLRTTGIDVDSDYLRYKIDLCTNLAMNFECQTFDQTSSQTGWSGQDTQTSTAYTSGTQAIYTVQVFLQPGTTYYWRSYAIDPGGKNVWSSTQPTPNSFTTMSTPLPASSCYIQESISDTQLSVVWTDNASNEDFYEIQRKVDGGSWTVLQTGMAANTINKIDNTITNGHTYQYRIAPYFVGPFYASWCEASTLTIGTGLFNIEGIKASGLHFN